MTSRCRPLLSPGKLFDPFYVTPAIPPPTVLSAPRNDSRRGRRTGPTLQQKRAKKKKNKDKMVQRWARTTTSASSSAAAKCTSCRVWEYYCKTQGPIPHTNPYSAQNPPNGFLNVAAATPSREQVAARLKGAPPPLVCLLPCYATPFSVSKAVPGGWVWMGGLCW